jgi:iron complex outermembrane recepter protein
MPHSSTKPSAGAKMPPIAKRGTPEPIPRKSVLVIRRLWALGRFATVLGLAHGVAVADEAHDPLTPRLIITASPAGEASRHLPVAHDTITHRDIHSGHALVGLSELMGTVPGLVVNNRHNHAQDLQISSRGFGTRASFGVRGIRLYSDGIPATMPDGQGQLAHLDLASAGRIEVMRGPFSVLYGNAAGGVIALTTEDGRSGQHAQLDVGGGSFGSERIGVKFSGDNGTINHAASLGYFRTDGYRDHSRAQRTQANAKLRLDLDNDATLTLIANALDAPKSLDPMGLTDAQWRSDPRQANPNAARFNTRKSVRQEQLGLVWERPLVSDTQLRIATWGGDRDVVQYQSIPVATQTDPRHPGGVIDLARRFAGSDIRVTHQGDSLESAFGVAFETMDEHRRGYANYFGSTLGVKGALRRDEDNQSQSRDVYAQSRWQLAPQLAPRWQLLAGVRRSEVRFRTDDNFINPGNGDDSGHTRYSATTPALGLTYTVSPALDLYGSWGKGFETPTANELAYQSTSTAGLNTTLDAARSRHHELGLKARIGADARLTLARFEADTTDEIGQISSSGGRGVFGNVGDTTRRGWELALAWRAEQTANGAFAQLAYTQLEASYRDATASGAAPGNALPGAAKNTFYGELGWRHAASGFTAALETRASSRVFANDANTATAPSYEIANLRIGLERTSGAWHSQAFIRIDNLSDTRYIGSVIVNESQQRYFEPSPGRTAWIGASVRLALP